jgi:hypothetical protein
MLLLNCCIAFTVDNVRRNRKTRNNRNSSIIRRPPRQRSVSFSDPLVVPAQSAQKKTRLVQDIEMVDLRSIPTVPIQEPKPQPSTLTKQRKPCRPAPPPPAQMSRPISFPNFPPPPVPTLNRSRAPSLRSLTTRRAPPPPVVPTPSAATLPRQTRHVQSAQASGMQAQAVPSRSAMNLPGLPGQSQSAQSFGMQAQQAVPIAQSTTSLPRPNMSLPRQRHPAQSFGMQGQQAVPIAQSARSLPRPNMSLPRQIQTFQSFGMQGQQAVPIVQSAISLPTTFPRAADKKRSRNDDLSQNPLYQKCLHNNSK